MDCEQSGNTRRQGQKTPDPMPERLGSQTPFDPGLLCALKCGIIPRSLTIQPGWRNW